MTNSSRNSKADFWFYLVLLLSLFTIISLVAAGCSSPTGPIEPPRLPRSHTLESGTTEDSMPTEHCPCIHNGHAHNCAPNE